MIEQVAENEFIVQGKMTLTEFNDEFGTKLEMDDIDTVAGYIIAKTGKIPDDDEVLTRTTPPNKSNCSVIVVLPASG